MLDDMRQELGRLIYDDDGLGMESGSVVLVNGEHERVIHFEGDEICIHGWPDDEMIFTVERVDHDDIRDDWPR